MQQLKLVVKQRVAYKVTTKIKHSDAVADNLLNQILPLLLSMKYGRGISPIYTQQKAGCIWRLSWIYIHAELLGGILISV